MQIHTRLPHDRLPERGYGIGGGTEIRGVMVCRSVG